MTWRCKVIHPSTAFLLRSVTAPKRKRFGFKGMPPHPTYITFGAFGLTMQDIDRSVHVPIQYQTTIRAGMRALRQTFLYQFAALRTHFRRITGVYQDDGSASFYRFADCQADKLCPCYIQNAFSHASTTAHLHRSEFLEYDHLMSIHQRTALLMGKISTSIRNSLVNTRQNAFLFGVFRPVLCVLSRVLPFLYSLYVGFIPPIEARCAAPTKLGNLV